MPGIVVSADGSANSRNALEWAVTHAALEHAPLTVLAVHQVAASEWTGNPIIYAQDRPEARRVMHAVEDTVEETISKLGDGRPSSVTVRGTIGQSANALIEASHDADMVVVHLASRMVATAWCQEVCVLAEGEGPRNFTAGRAALSWRRWWRCRDCG